MELGHSWYKDINTRSPWTINPLLLKGFLLVFKFQRCPGPLVLCVGGAFGCRCIGGQSLFLCCALATGFQSCSIVSEKQLSISLNRLGPFSAGFMFTFSPSKGGYGSTSFQGGAGGSFPHQAILQHQQGVLQFNLFYTLPTWRQHHITQVKGSVPQDCPFPYTHTLSRLIYQVTVVTCF